MNEWSLNKSKNLKIEKSILEGDIRNYSVLLSRKWVIRILHLLQINNRTFSELINELNLSNQELSKKLKLLTEYQLITKTKVSINKKDNYVYESKLVSDDFMDLLYNLSSFGKKYLSIS